MTKPKPFKLTFKYALKKAYSYWKRQALQVQQGSTGELDSHYYGRCAIGCALPRRILNAAKEAGVECPVGLKKKKLIKATRKDIIRLNKLMKAHDSGVYSLQEFFVRHGMIKGK